MKWGQYYEHQALISQLHNEAAQERLVKTAHEAQKQSRLAGYFERITSFRHEKHQG